MAYILQYFDDLIEEFEVYYFKPNSICISSSDLHEEIRKEGLLVQEKLRAIYYTEGEERKANLYFLKINKRLISLIKTVNSGIQARKPHLVIEYRKWGNISYNNLHSIRNEMIGILGLLAYEFEVLGIEVGLISDSGETIISNEIFFKDHLFLRKCISEGQEIPVELIEKYDISYYLEDLTRDYYEDTPLHRLEAEIGVDYSNFAYSFVEFQEVYQRDYVTCKLEKSFIYSHIWDLLVDSTKDIISEEKKIKSFIDFFLHTGLCVSIVVNYFNREIQFLQNSNNFNFHTYLSELATWLNEVRAEPKHRKYHVSRIEDSYDDVFKEIGDLLDYYKSLYPVKLNGGLDHDSELKTTSQFKKLVIDRTAKELGVIVDALDKVKIFPNNSKKDIANAFAMIIKSSSRNISGDHLENTSSGWESDSEEAEYVQKKLNLMIRHVATKKNK